MGNPVGFRFNPTEEELLSYFLKNKILGIPLMEWEKNQFIEANLYGENCNPWDLMRVDDETLPWQDVVDSVNKVVHSQKVLYVFTVLSNVGKGEKNNKQKNRVAGCGSWHGNSKAEPVRGMGKRATFTFRSAQETIGQWSMTEYSIDAAANGIPRNHKNYVLCKIKVDDSKTCMGGRVVARKRKIDVVNVEEYKLEKTKKSVNCFEISNPTSDYCSEISTCINHEEGTTASSDFDSCCSAAGLEDFQDPLLPLVVDVDTEEGILDHLLGMASNSDDFDSYTADNFGDFDFPSLPPVMDVLVSSLDKVDVLDYSNLIEL